jgi:O-antigen biosynthesis protein WbqP
MYKRVFKRLLDLILSFCAIIVLAIPMLIIIIAIKIDDPGPAIFKQKRVGIKKNGKLTYFSLLKFRSMKVNTPDVPTHLLEHPEQYISRVGAFLRKSSLDELPQIYNIFLSQMSVIGPRPALWNQYDLIAERDKYGANDIKPGLTGWAQINGRDKIGIKDKAQLDGDYAQLINETGMRIDVRCFLKTIGKVLKREGIVEGSTQEIKTETEKEVVSK